jgi:CheY-like chemotaxis protein
LRLKRHGFEDPDLLVAEAAETDAAFQWCLFDCDLTFVRTFADAITKLGERVFSIVLIDLHFAESQMLELLDYVRSLTEYEDVPVVCVQRTGEPPSLDDQNKINAAVKAHGGRAFVNLCGEEEPLQQACQYLRQIVAFEVGLPISPIPPCA